MNAITCYFVLLALGHFETAGGSQSPKDTPGESGGESHGKRTENASASDRPPPQAEAAYRHHEGTGGSADKQTLEGAGVYVMPLPVISIEDVRWFGSVDKQTFEGFEKKLQALISSQQLREDFADAVFLAQLARFLRYRKVFYHMSGERYRDACTTLFLKAAEEYNIIVDRELDDPVARCLELAAGNMGTGYWITPLPGGVHGYNFLDTWSQFGTMLRENTLRLHLTDPVEQTRFWLFFRMLGAELQNRGILIESIPDRDVIRKAETGELSLLLADAVQREALLDSMSDSVLASAADNVLGLGTRKDDAAATSASVREQASEGASACVTPSPSVSLEDLIWFTEVDVETFVRFESELQALISSRLLREKFTDISFRLRLARYLRFRKILCDTRGVRLRDRCATFLLKAARKYNFFVNKGLDTHVARCLELEAGNMGTGHWIDPISGGTHGNNFLDTWREFGVMLRENSLRHHLTDPVEQTRFWLFFKMLGAELRNKRIPIESAPDRDIILKAESGELIEVLDRAALRNALLDRMGDTVLASAPETVLGEQ